MTASCLNITAACPIVRFNKKEGSSDLPSQNEVDLATIERAKQGDLSAYRVLVETYQQRVFSIALGVVGNSEDAQDIAQEAFLKVFRKLSSFRGQSSFYTWLYRIVFNLSVDLSRKRYRHREVMKGDNYSLDRDLQESSNVPSNNIVAVSADPEVEYSRSQLRDGLDLALGELSSEHKAVIMLREIDGLSYQEISDVIGCSKGTVMSRLHHARRRLQKALQGFRGDGQGQTS